MARHPDDHKAAALSYKKGDYAPRVIAKGHGPAAEAIISLARESGIYIHESPELVEMLMQVDLKLLQSGKCQFIGSACICRWNKIIRGIPDLS